MENMFNKKKQSIYSRLITATVSALIGAIMIPIFALIFSGGLSLEEIGKYAIGGTVCFAILGFTFPKQIKKVLFVLTLFQ